MRFGEKLLDAGLIDAAQLEAGLRHQKQTGQLLGEALLELGYLSEENFLRFLAREFNTRYASTEKLSRVAVPVEVLDRIPYQMAEQHLIFPLRVDPKTRTLGLLSSRPQEKEVIDEARIVSESPAVEVYVACREAILALVKKHYRGDLNAFSALLSRDAAAVEPTTDLYADRRLGEETVPAQEQARPRSSGPAVEDSAPAPSRREGSSSWTRQIEAVRSGSLVSDNDFIESLNILVGLIELQRSQFQGHSARVARLVKAVSEHFGLAEREVHHHIIAAYLHDLGKRASTHLTLLSIQHADEYKKRAQRYYLTPSRLFDSVHLPIQVNHVLGHLYENFDGTGIPEQLSGEGIPLGSRILAAVDALEDLISNPSNVFGEVLAPEAAFERLRQKSGALFDPKVLQLLEEAYGGESARASLSAHSPLVLLADPDAGSTSVLELKLVKQGFRVRVARDSAAAVNAVLEENVATAVVELRLQPEDGFSVVEKIRESRPELPVFMLTGEPTSVMVNRAFKLGVVDFITRPYVPEVLVAKLAKEIERHPPPERRSPALAVKVEEDDGATPGVVIQVEETAGGACEPATPEATTDTGRRTVTGTGSGSGGSFSGSGGTRGMISGALSENRTVLMLVRALVGKKRTGKLSLRSGAHKGEIFIQGGLLFQASLGELEGEEAFLELAGWKECVYQFDPSSLPPARDIKTPTPQLLQIAAMSLGG